MKKVAIIYILFLLTLAGFASQKVKYFQVDRVKTFKGEITDIKTEECYQNEFIILYLKEKANGEILRVETSPDWYFNLDLLKGSKVEVAGSYSQNEQQNTIIVQSITYRGEVYAFRDKFGFPLWRGKGKHMNRGQQGKGKHKRRGRH